MHSRVKRSLHWIGGGVCIAGVFFVALRLSEYRGEIDIERFDVKDGYVVASLALAYGLSNTFLARAWWRILAFQNIRASWMAAFRIYGLSQLARYVPGNILHLAGRQSLGLAAGMPGWALAKSSLWELGLICAAGALFSLLALPLVWPAVTLVAAGATFTVAAFATATAGGWMFGAGVARAFLGQVLFLALSGAIFVVSIDVVTESSAGVSASPAWVAAYVVAWLVGFVTPGAPAGLGVREAVLLFLLAGRIAEPDLVMAVLLGRIITVGGDFLFFVLATGLALVRKADAAAQD